MSEGPEPSPHASRQCTYSLGPMRQAIFLCSTCPEPRGLCFACSITCHADHEQVELYFKRKFRCDCPTTAIAHPCKLHPKLEELNEENRYNHNFHGRFCRCGKTYDLYKEKEPMIQCLACEDWFHESCCNLREEPPSRGDAPEPTIPSESAQLDFVNGAASEALLPPLPSPLISKDAYQSFICGECACENVVLMRWAGSPGIMMVYRQSAAHPWRCLGQEGNSEPPAKSGTKRSLVPNTTVPTAKRPRNSSDTAKSSACTSTRICVAPTQSPLVENLFTDLGMEPLLWLFAPNTRIASQTTGDIFLTKGFRERWCGCNHCQRDLKDYPYLLEEETYDWP